MFDYSMMDNANRIIAENATKGISITDFIRHEIDEYRNSLKYRQMLDGHNYYIGKHDILKKERTVIGEGGKVENVKNLHNAKQIDNQYKKMVKQKYNYILGKPLTVKTDNEQYAKVLNIVFNANFQRQMKNVCKDSLNCGIGWIYVYYDEQGEFKIKKFNPYELVPGWKDAEHTELEYMIRHYPVQVYDGNVQKEVIKIEYYSSDGIDYYEVYESGVIPCPPYHTSYMTVADKEYNWNRLPFIGFKYNEEEIPLIVNCKSLQDGINTILSNFEDNMCEDMRNTILVLVNYDGTNLGEFRRNLATYGAVKVNSVDGVNGDVRALKVEVNADNYKSILDIFKKALIENCMGYDAKDERMSGTPNQMNIQSMYNDIDLDAADMQTEYKASLEQLLWFVNAYLSSSNQGNFENEKVEFMFNTDMPMDEGQTIQNIQGSVGILSTETLISNHPWVDDPQAELDKLKKEKEENIEQYGNAFGESNNGNSNNTDDNATGDE